MPCRLPNTSLRKTPFSMEQRLSERMLGLSPSATFAMAQKSADLAASGIDVVNMSVGEPDFDTPEHVRRASFDAISEGWTKYSPVPGYASLRQAACGKLLRENGLSYEPSEIVIGNGAKQCICNAVMALCGPGDEVVIPAPYWVSYPQMVKLAGADPVFVSASLEQRFKITPAQLAAALTPRSRMLILCSPCNPSGAVYSRPELEALAEVIRGHERLIVLSDEIYEHINYTGSHASIAALPGMKERTVVVNGVSKAYAMTGWRIGFMAAPAWIASACNMLQGQYTSGPSSVSQKAAEAAWNGSQECVEEMRQSFLKRRNLLVSLLREIPGLEVNEPEGAFYLLPRCSSFFGKSAQGHTINSGDDLAMYLLECGHVATVGGNSFGAPDCIRLSYATSEDNIREAAARMKTALAALS